MAHRIRAALPEHVAALPGIESAAASRFADTPFDDAVRDDSMPLEELHEALFYTKLGFRVLEPEELGPALATLVCRESERGLRAEDRVVMRRLLGAEQ